MQKETRAANIQELLYCSFQRKN